MLGFIIDLIRAKLISFVNMTESLQTESEEISTAEIVHTNIITVHEVATKLCIPQKDSTQTPVLIYEKWEILKCIQYLERPISQKSAFLKRLSKISILYMQMYRSHTYGKAQRKLIKQFIPNGVLLHGKQ